MPQRVQRQPPRVPCGGVARYVVGRVDVKFHSTVRKNLADCRDDHPDTCDGSHCGKRSDLVEVILQSHGRILKRAACVNHIISDLEKVLSA